MLEKVPFFALAAAASVVTLMVQQREGAVKTVANLSLAARSENAVIAYCRYLGKLFWPRNLAFFYPHPGYWPLWQVLLAGGVLLSITLVLAVNRKRYPFLLMGWLWYCGTLVPVLGWVQVGEQAMADRYTYVPSIGMLIFTIWGVHELTRSWRLWVVGSSVAAGAAIVVGMLLTRQQLGYWRNSEALYRHAMEATENNYLAHHLLGVALGRQGRVDEAITEMQEAIRLRPAYAEAHGNLGAALGAKGQLDQAIGQFQETIRLKPDYAEAHNNLGVAFDRQGRVDEAVSHLQEAIRLKPASAATHFNLGNALLNKGQVDDAILQFQQAIRLNPEDANARDNLARAQGMGSAPPRH
jgi:Flp pilus assembly protein TadD